MHSARIRTYCTPEALLGVSDVLYLNNGDGTFTDVSEKAGVSEVIGKGLGVVCGDMDNDGDVDIFVANDTTPNLLYRNNPESLKMTEDALFSGVALSEEGRAYSGMGANLGDFDNDGYLDIIITTFKTRQIASTTTHRAVSLRKSVSPKVSARRAFRIWHGV